MHTDTSRLQFVYYGRQYLPISTVQCPWIIHHDAGRVSWFAFFSFAAPIVVLREHLAQAVYRSSGCWGPRQASPISAPPCSGSNSVTYSMQSSESVNSPSHFRVVRICPRLVHVRFTSASPKA